MATGKFTKIRFEDFMSLGDVTIEFDENNIIDIAGFNDSGKSAITRGLEVIFYNAYSLDQVKFIKDDMDFFRITLEEDTGYKLVREKHTTGKSVWTLTKNGEAVFNNSTGDGKAVYSVSEVPEVVANFLGVIQDEHTNEKLNVRRNIDKLFLINTTGGDNYKILNTILRSDILSESSKRINEDRNKKQAELGNLNVQVQTLRGELSKFDVAPLSIVNETENCITNLKATRERVMYIDHIMTQKQEMQSFAIYDEVGTIDATHMQDIQNIVNLMNGLDVEIYPEVNSLDASRMLDIQNILTLRQQLDVCVPPETGVINSVRFNAVMELAQLYNNMYKCNSDLMSTDTELKQVNDELSKLATQLNYKICHNCGSAVV